MNTQNKFSGVWTAIATPFHEDGRIDWQAWELLLDQQSKSGVKGIVVCGTTGESPTLKDSEKVELFVSARKLLSKDVLLMAGTGTNCTQETLAFSRKVLESVSVDALLVVTPPYNKPNPSGMFLHYETLAKSVTVPICLYHVPGRTAQKLSADQLENLCAIPGVSILKEASADLFLFSQCTSFRDVTVLTGDDFTFLPSLSVGGHGVISVVSNVFPAETVKLMRAFQQSDTSKALAYHNALLPTIDALFYETNPCPLKAALEIMNLAKNYLRLPLGPVAESNFQKIERAIAKTKSLLANIES